MHCLSSKEIKVFKNELKFCNTCWHTSCKIYSAAIKAAFHKLGFLITPPAVGAHIVPPGFLARSVIWNGEDFVSKLSLSSPQQGILCSELLRATPGAGNKWISATLVASSLDVATHRPLSLLNHTIMPKLKKERDGERREKQECGVGGNWLVGKQLAWGT